MTEHNLSMSSIIKTTSYRTGYPVDKVKSIDKLPHHVLDEAEKTLSSMIVLINWIAMATRSDIGTLTNLLARNLHQVMPGHVAAAKHIS